MKNTSNKIIGIIEFCQSTFVSEYSIEKLLLKWMVSNPENHLTNNFIIKFSNFINKLPLVLFNNSEENIGKITDQLKKIALEKAEVEYSTKHNRLNIIKPRKTLINYL